jgi:hypothetical protein
MSASSLETWAWLLIYAGALLLSLASFMFGLDDALAGGMVVVGVLALGLGVVFIWRRSRLG